MAGQEHRLSAGSVRQAGEVRSSTLESLRALAALGVMTGHVWGVSHNFDPTGTESTFARRILYGGGFGVFLFFALSGYLLFRPFVVSAFGSGERVNLRRYALNRVLRILPLYYVAVILGLLLLSHGAAASVWLRFLTLTENFSSSTIGTVDGSLWSLVVEVHFYILLPFLAFGIARLAGRSLVRAAAILVVLGLISFGLWHHYVDPANGGAPLWRYNLPATFMFFVPGMLLALARVAWERRPPAWLPALARQSDLWLLAGAVVLAVILHDYGLTAAMVFCSALVVGACVLPLRRGPLTRALEWRPLALIGVISYSLYVWHLPLIAWLWHRSWGPHSYLALLAVATPVCLGAAAISYRAIESPFLRMRKQWARASAPQAGGEPAPGGQLESRPALGGSG